MTKSPEKVTWPSDCPITVAQEIDDALKTRQQRAAENLEVARLENSLIFQLDDKPIPGVDIPQSIALGHRPNKRKREAAFNEEPSGDAVLLANSFRGSMAVLAEALRARHEAPTPGPANDLLSQRITTLEEKFDGTLGNMQDTMGRVLQAFAGLNAAAGLGLPAGIPIGSLSASRGTTAGAAGAAGGTVPDKSLNEKYGGGSGK